jgi:hypothetical protein
VGLRDREKMVSYYRAVYASTEKTVALLRGPAPDTKALVVNAYRATNSIRLHLAYVRARSPGPPPEEAARL